jgi:hypothetical protein
MRIPATAHTLAPDALRNDTGLVETVGPLLQTLVAHLRVLARADADDAARMHARSVDPHTLLALAEACCDELRRWAPPCEPDAERRSPLARAPAQDRRGQIQSCREECLLLTPSFPHRHPYPRAVAAYARRCLREGRPPQEPAAAHSGLVDHAGRRYVVLATAAGVLAVYRVKVDGMLRELRRWPRTLPL